MKIETTGDLFAQVVKGAHKDTVFVVLHETFLSSILKDGITFGFVVAMSLLNHALGWDSWVLDALAICAVLMFVFRHDTDKTFQHTDKTFQLTKAELVDMVRRVTAEPTDTPAQT